MRETILIAVLILLAMAEILNGTVALITLLIMMRWLYVEKGE